MHLHKLFISFHWIFFSCGFILLILLLLFFTSVSCCASTFLFTRWRFSLNFPSRTLSIWWLVCAILIHFFPLITVCANNQFWHSFLFFVHADFCRCFIPIMWFCIINGVVIPCVYFYTRYTSSAEYHQWRSTCYAAIAMYVIVRINSLRCQANIRQAFMGIYGSHHINFIFVIYRQTLCWLIWCGKYEHQKMGQLLSVSTVIFAEGVFMEHTKKEVR